MESSTYRVLRRNFGRLFVPGFFAAVLVLTVLLVGCAWELRDTANSGSLTISFRGPDGIGALDITQFNEITFFVVDSTYFRTVPRDQIQVPLRSGGFAVESARESFLFGYDPSPDWVDVVFTAVEVDFGSDAGAVPGGGFQRYFPGNDPPDEVKFENLIVGREYVVWADGLIGEIEDRLGFAFPRIRSGADTTVTLQMPTDRFEGFVESLYDRYVVPNLPPPPPLIFDFTEFILFGEGEAIEFDFTEYVGEGSAQVTIDGVGPVSVSFTEAYVVRWVVEQQGELFTLFFLEFWGTDPEFDTWYYLDVMLFEEGNVAEPNRGSYGAQIGAEGQPNSGSVVWIWVEEWVIEVSIREFFAASNPSPFSAGFSGGAPSAGGTFTAGFSGPFLESMEGEITEEGEPIPISVQSFSFTFGEELIPQ